MSEHNIQRIQVDIPVRTVREAKAAAAMAGVNFSTFCAKALAMAVQVEPESARAA